VCENTTDNGKRVSRKPSWIITDEKGCKGYNLLRGNSYGVNYRKQGFFLRGKQLKHRNI